MRTTLTSLIVATALAAAGSACKKDAEETPTVAQKPIERADEAAENLREAEVPSAGEARDEVAEANREIGEARMEAREDVAEGDKTIAEAQRDVAETTREQSEDMREEFSKVQGELRGLSKDAADFVSNRDRVAADVRSSLDMIDQRISKLQAHAGTMTGNARAEMDSDIAELKALSAEARSESQALSSATAETWDKARDESLDSLQRLFDKTAEASAGMMVK